MFAAALFGLALLQDPSVAAGAPAQPAQTEREREDAEREARLNEVICRREHVVGSNRPERICQTRRAWEHRRDSDQEAMRDGGTRAPDSSTVQAGAGR